MSEALARSYWDFIDDAAKDNVIVMKIASRGFNGEEMINELHEQPVIDFGAFSVNFNEDIWNINTGDELSPGVKQLTSAVFDNMSRNNDVLKLFLLTQIVWKTNKTHICVYNYARIKAVLNKYEMNDKDLRTTILTADQYKKILENVKATRSSSTRYSDVRSLSVFLDFMKMFFKLPVDPDLAKAIQREMKETSQLQWNNEGVPAIDDAYLEPLVAACIQSLDDDNEEFDYRLTAAVLLLASQIGMRISEVAAMETGTLRISSMKGKEDIAYLEFKTFKGAKGDGGYMLAKTIVNPTALKAYLWLDENCKQRREEIGTNALAVRKRQQTKFMKQDAIRVLAKSFILKHHDTIPCVDTQDRFPEFRTSTVKTIADITPKQDLGKLGLTGDETFVYPNFHAFRATVATKLYEAGVDMRYIRKHMSHISEDTTAGYIRSDREIEKQNSDLVYKTVLGDGAQMLGPHGDEFMAKVNAYIETLPEQVKGDIDEVVQAAAKAYPLRRKVGGVCIRCGKIVPCKRNDETDQIYCAFGVCPNQCCLYFMAADCLDTVRSHIELVDANLERNHTKAARNELRKAQNVIRDCLVPELDSLDQQIGKLGRDGVLERFPDLEELVDNIDDVRKETELWLTRTI